MSSCEGTADDDREDSCYHSNRSVSIQFDRDSVEDIKANIKRSEEYSDSPAPLVDDRDTATWLADKPAKDYFISLLSSTYALFVVLFSLIIEISPKWQTEIWVAETVFYSYMYSLALLFFGYCYLFMLYPGWWNAVLKMLQRYRLLANAEPWLISKPSHAGEGAGTLYLRLGAVLFGCISIVLYGIEVFLCISAVECRGYQLAKNCLAGLFTFAQMHFIFCNSKFLVSGSRHLAKFGFMHLVAVNIWTWFRFVIAKNAAKAAKKAAKYGSYAVGNSSLHLLTASSSSEESADEEDYVTEHGFLSQVMASTLDSIIKRGKRDAEDGDSKSLEEAVDTAAGKSKDILGLLFSVDYLGDMTSFLTTCVVEYSLIGAAVMFILWTAIDKQHGDGNKEKKRKHRMRIDCSSSSSGLFFGLMMLIVVLVSISVHYIFDQLKNSNGAQIVFSAVDIAIFLSTFVACVVGLWQMRHLQFNLHHHGEVIDEILLYVGLAGEVIYCCIGVDLFMAASQPAYLLVAYITRLVQVIVQSVYILTASKLTALSPRAQSRKPGKQVVTFLCVCNATLFILLTFEGTSSAPGLACGSAAYPAIIYAVAPLTVFFRFHSSACLAEIWKHSYQMKDGHTKEGDVEGHH